MDAPTTVLVALAALSCLLIHGVAAQSGCAQCPSVVSATSQLCAVSAGKMKPTRGFDSACALDRYNCINSSDKFIFQNQGLCAPENINKLLISPVQTTVQSIQQKASVWPVQYIPSQQLAQQPVQQPASFYNPFRGLQGSAPTSWMQPASRPLAQYRPSTTFQQTAQYRPVVWPLTPAIAVPLPPKPITTPTTAISAPVPSQANTALPAAAICNLDAWKCSERMYINGTIMKCVVAFQPVAGAVPSTTTGVGWQVPFFCDDVLNKAAQSMTAASAVATPPGYTLVAGSGIYKVHTTSATWDEAKATCESEVAGGHLALPNTAADYQVVFDLIKQAAPGASAGAYVGYRDIALDRNFVAVTGQPNCMRGPMLYFGGSPNNFGGNENCLALGYGGQANYNDCPCSMSLPFVCEVTLPALTGLC